MEQARLFTAIVLSFIVFFAWNYFFVDKEAIKKPTIDAQIDQPVPAETEKQPDLKGTAETVAGKVIGLNGAAVAVSQPQPLQTPRVITVNTPLYSVQISNLGAVFKSMALKEYRESVEAGSPLKEMVSPEIEKGTVRLEFGRNSISGLDSAVFKVDAASDVIEVVGQEKNLSFSWRSPEGMIIEKNFTFSPETYLIGYDITLHNGSDRNLQDDLIVSLVKPAAENTSRFGFEGPLALIDNQIEEVKLKKLKDKNIFTGNLKWIAVADRYFMSSVLPAQAKEASMRLLLENNILMTQFQQPTGTLKPGVSQSYDFKLFMGPKSVDVLKKSGHDLDKAVDFGFFDFLAKPCLWMMNFLYGIIPNYGVAIIILTILLKIVLWPLGTKSYSSMNDMKKLQPLMAEIREKYKHDKQKMNTEIMALYKTYKVNPVSGCLPMVAQMPIFFALYRMLYEAIELRHAPFWGWINDLSAPDRLFRFDFAIPLMEAPYGIPVLTIIMGATMFLQQKMSPPAGDPVQAKMMMFMPLVFTAIFINFSSGLVLYWLVNNILSIAQQYYITKKA